MIFAKDLPIDDKYPESCVYWIYHVDKHSDPRVYGYVGISSKGFEARFKRHLKDARCNSQLVVHRAMRKYGDKIGVKVLFKADPEFCLLVEYMLRPVARMQGTWNIQVGGNLGNLGTKASPETLAKMSAALKGRQISPEHANKIAVANSGKVRSPEIVAQMRERMVGFKQSDESRAKISKTMLGRRHSATAIQNMSNAQSNRKRSDTEIANLIARNKKGLSQESERKRITNLRATRQSSPWRNSSVRDLSVWAVASAVESVLRENPTCNTNKLAKMFNTTRDKMETIHNKLKSGWQPLLDEVYMSWLEEYNKQKETENVA